jgi:hypothetical protein
MYSLSKRVRRIYNARIPLSSAEIRRAEAAMGHGAETIGIKSEQ